MTVIDRWPIQVGITSIIGVLGCVLIRPPDLPDTGIGSQQVGLSCPRAFRAYTSKYEDLINGKVDFRRLESCLGIEIRENVALDVFVGRTAVRQRLSWHERLIISKEAGPGMKALGYSK
jgi:hypothetical protein